MIVMYSVFCPSVLVPSIYCCMWMQASAPNDIKSCVFGVVFLFIFLFCAFGVAFLFNFSGLST